MPVSFTSPVERAQQMRLAKYKVRLINPDTNELLHMSGEGTTKNVNWSWIGFAFQADNLRKRAAKEKRDWPFTPVHRSLLEPIQEIADA